MSRIDEIRAMLNEGNEVIIANRARSSLEDLLEEIDALRARCEVAEYDLAVERGCLTCWYMDEECPADCDRHGSKWKWRGPDRPGVVQCAPGGAPVSGICQRS